MYISNAKCFFMRICFHILISLLRFSLFPSLCFSPLSDGSSRGFAIVKFDKEQDAQKMIDELDGSMIADRKIEVRRDRGVETLRGKQKRIYVSQLPSECSEAEIREVFEGIGKIESIELCKRGKTNTVWAILCYESTDAAISAVEQLHHTKFGESELVVRLDRKVAKK